MIIRQEEVSSSEAVTLLPYLATFVRYDKDESLSLVWIHRYLLLIHNFDT